MTHDTLANLVILVVEDNPANLLLARVMLERAGCHVREATSTIEARQSLSAVAPDLILMDVGLPGEDGLSLTRELKSTAEWAGIPIIALTAHAMQRDRERAFDAGCDGYLAKPFKTQQLHDEITRALDVCRPQSASETDPMNE